MFLVSVHTVLVVPLSFSWLFSSLRFLSLALLFTAVPQLPAAPETLLFVH